jgi:hypothetical protein
VRNVGSILQRCLQITSIRIEISGMMAVAVQGLLHKVWDALRLDEEEMTPCSFAFSKAMPISRDWRCVSTDLEARIKDRLGPGMV